MITSTPKQAFKVLIREELEPYSRTGVVFRAFREGGVPLYVGAETRGELLEKLARDHPLAVVEEA